MNKEEAVKQELDKLFSLLEISSDVSVETVDDVVNVNLTTEDTGMLIGYHGETLDSLQLILSLLVSKKLGEFARISLEIGDYKKNRTNSLEAVVNDAKNKVLETQEAVSLPNLKPWERRIVHMLLQDDKEVVSESIGEGRDRTLTIRVRQ